MNATESGFIESMDDDFNTSGAWAISLTWFAASTKPATKAPQMKKWRQHRIMLRKLSGVLGLQLNEKEEGDQSAAPFIDLLVELRTEIRKEKLYALSDQIRDRLAELGVTLEDSKHGTTWHFKQVAQQATSKVHLL